MRIDSQCLDEEGSDTRDVIEGGSHRWNIKLFTIAVSSENTFLSKPVTCYFLKKLTSS